MGKNQFKIDFAEAEMRILAIQARLKGQIKDLLDKDSGLTDWEMEFCDDMYKKDWPFTEAEENKIDELYLKHCG